MPTAPNRTWSLCSVGSISLRANRYFGGNRDRWAFVVGIFVILHIKQTSAALLVLIAMHIVAWLQNIVNSRFSYL